MQTPSSPAPDTARRSPGGSRRAFRGRKSGGSHAAGSDRRKAVRARAAGALSRLPSPLRGLWEAVGPLLVVALLTVVPVAVMGIGGGFGALEQPDIAALGGLNFLLNQGASVSYSLPAERGLHAVSGALTLTPLLGAVILTGFASAAGGRMHAAARSGSEFLLSSFSYLATVGVLDALVAWIATTPFAQADILSAVGMPVAWSAIGLLTGACLQAGGPVAFAGRTEWVRSKGQWWKWGLDYARALGSSLYATLLSLAAFSAFALAIAIGAHWAPIMYGYESSTGTLAGIAGVTAVHFGYLPNLLAMTLAWLSGAGFSFGSGTLVSPLATTTGALPPVPVLAAMPTGAPAWAMSVLAIPVLCGAIGAWCFLREGEDHLGEWLQLKMGPGYAASSLGAGLNSLVLGLGAGLFGALAAWASRGSLGVGRFTEVGADPLRVLWMLGLEVFLGALLGFLAVPWLEFDEGE